MLGAAVTKKIFLLEISNGACIKKVLELSIFGDTGTKKLNSRKMLDGTGI